MDKNNKNLYLEEISLITSPEYREYVRMNLRKIQEFRRKFNIPVIGIAGTEGKTTTKRMLQAILQQRGPVLETPLDCDSARDVTATLLNLEEKHKFALLEMGIINLEQFKLAVEIAEPNIGIVTNIGEAHKASLGDKYFIADSKVELIRNLPASGYTILNIDDDLVSGMEVFSPTQQIIKFGFNNNAHFHALEIKYLGPDGMEFSINGFYKLHLPIYSATSVSNALAAISTARILNFEFEEITAGLSENFKMIEGRGNLLNFGDVYILDHTYNATINAVNKAVESLIQFKKYSKKLILVLGAIDDLGKKSEKYHLNLGYYISALPVDTVITVGCDARLVAKGITDINHNKKELIHCEEPEALPDQLLNILEPGSTVLLTGGQTLNLKESLQTIVKRINSSL